MWTESFDNYIVVFDLCQREVHTKSDDQVIGMPRIFTKLLKRTLMKFGPKMDDISIGIQIKQAFFNAILIIQAFIDSNQYSEMDDLFNAKKQADQSESRQGEGSHQSDNDSDDIFFN